MEKEKKSGFAALLPSGRLDRALTVASLILSAAIIVAAVCYAASCISIYSGGGPTPFTREIAAEHLKRLLPVSIVTVALAITAGILSLFTEKPKAKAIPIKNKALLRITEGRLSDAHLSEEYLLKSSDEAKHRRIIALIAIAVSAVIATVALIFILDPSRYTVADANTDIAYSAVIALAATLVILSGVYAVSILNEQSYKRVLAVAREELARQKACGVCKASAEPELAEGHTVIIVRLIILAVAVAFIIIGSLNGGMADVLGKAVRICTECIGLG